MALASSRKPKTRPAGRAPKTRPQPRLMNPDTGMQYGHSTIIPDTDTLQDVIGCANCAGVFCGMDSYSKHRTNTKTVTGRRCIDVDSKSAMLKYIFKKDTDFSDLVKLRHYSAARAHVGKWIRSTEQYLHLHTTTMSPIPTGTTSTTPPPPHPPAPRAATTTSPSSEPPGPPSFFQQRPAPAAPSSLASESPTPNCSGNPIPPSQFSPAAVHPAKQQLCQCLCGDLLPLSKFNIHCTDRTRVGWQRLCERRVALTPPYEAGVLEKMVVQIKAGRGLSTYGIPDYCGLRRHAFKLHAAQSVEQRVERYKSLQAMACQPQASPPPPPTQPPPVAPLTARVPAGTPAGARTIPVVTRSHSRGSRSSTSDAQL
jgi:hypothetical protein